MAEATTPSHPTRRRVLAQALATGALGGINAMGLTSQGMAWGAPTSAQGDRPRLLLVFLRGGYDCNHLLVPTGSSFYYESRPNIAIPRPGQSHGAIALDAHWGLHPALESSMWPLYQRKQLAFVPFAGTDDLSRSHFDTQDSIELGQTVGGQRDYRSGFLQRLLAELEPRNAGARAGAGSLPAIAFTSAPPLVMRGGLDVPNMALTTPGGRPTLDARESGLIASMYQGTRLATPVAEGFATREEVARTMQGEMDAASREALSTRGFEGTARRMARLMANRYSLGFVDVGGWDTHVAQGASSGTLANRLEELGRGLAAFSQEMGPQWASTVVVVISEFGRTFRENGNQGTDHGHGTVYWVMGGGVAGGRVAGEQQVIAANTLLQNRDHPVLNDYRAIFGGLFGSMYGLNAAALARVFPGSRPASLGLV